MKKNITATTIRNALTAVEVDATRYEIHGGSTKQLEIWADDFEGYERELIVMDQITEWLEGKGYDVSGVGVKGSNCTRVCLDWSGYYHSSAHKLSTANID